MAGIKQVVDLAAKLTRDCKDRTSTPGLLELQRHMRGVQQEFLILQQGRDKLAFENTRLKKEIASLKPGPAPAALEVLTSPAAPASYAAPRNHDGFVWDNSVKL